MTVRQNDVGPPQTDEPLRQRLRDALDDAIVPLIQGSKARICIVDPPGHPNVGDSAIFLGELAFLRRHFPGSRLSYCDYQSYSAHSDAEIEQSTILLFHGGGNFGTLWPHHHDFRLLIMERFRHKPMVQLPQSVHFNDESSLARTIAAVRKVPDFTLVARDRMSEAFARAHLPARTVLAPDMAFTLDLPRLEEPHLDWFCLLRSDKECVTDHRAITSSLAEQGRSYACGDWLDDTPGLSTWAEKQFARLAKSRPRLAKRVRFAALPIREGYAAHRVRQGAAMLSQGRVVATDRLHAHIMCFLMDIPHFVFDSLDGKIAALHETWLAGSHCSTMIGASIDPGRIFRCSNQL